MTALLVQQVNGLMDRVCKNYPVLGVDLCEILGQVDEWYRSVDHFRNRGVLESDMIQWSRLLSDVAVIAPVDKNKAHICISCPCHWQQRAASVQLPLLLGGWCPHLLQDRA